MARLTTPTPALKKDSYEAIVVGSGFGGAVAACRLSQAGLSVALLERGRRFEPGSFPRAGAARPDVMDWHRGGPYDVRPLNDVLVVQAAGYGGGSLIYANVQMRPPPDIFDESWPHGYTRATLDPYYDLVAHMLDVRPVEPDPATGELPAKTRLMEEAASRLGRAGQTFRPNIAVRFEGAGEPARPNKFGALQSGCLHCGECDIGCNLGAKNTLDLNYLAVAESLGADVGTECEATNIAPREDGFDVRFRDCREDGGERSVTARQVFLCLGAVNTTELLLRCRDQYGTLPKLSPSLGSGYSANGDFYALGLGTSPPFGATHGPTITTVCIFDRQDGDRRIWFALEDGGYSTYLAHLAPLLSPARLARLVGRRLEGRLAHHAESFASLLEQEGDATAILLVMGRDLANGRIELARPHHRLHVHWDTSANLPLYAAEAAACNELVTALGGRLALAPNWRFLGQPSSVHNLGGCRMAQSERDGVVDPEGRVYGYPGLYVLDGAIIPAAVGANPSHTIAAVAERCIEAAIRRMPGRERWRAPEAANAKRLVAPEDRVSIPQGGTAPPTVPSAGLRWQEVMRGAVTFEGVARRAWVDITITVADVSSFVVDPAHPGVVAGSVHVDGLTPPGGARIGGGSFHLFLDEGDPSARAMRYTLPFHDIDGRSWLLSGVKDVRGRRLIDFWRSTTTLATQIAAGERAAATASGQLRPRGSRRRAADRLDAGTARRGQVPPSYGVLAVRALLRPHVAEALRRREASATGMSAYHAEEWVEFGVALAGAAAVLAGLVFVSVSINLEKVLEIHGLPGRAGESIVMFAGVLILSICLLMPGQSRVALGVELLVGGALLLLLLVFIALPGLNRPTRQPLSWRVTRIVLALAASVPVIVSGVSLLAERGGGLYWLAAAFMLAFAAGIGNAWVLLVEVVRDERYRPVGSPDRR